jgi:glyoxylase-like metal-dependent hydrolase (beta-lactamase superfamily II)
MPDVLAAGLRHLDLRFQGVEGVIATAVVDTPDGPALVDPGPSSCLPELEAGLAGLGTSLADVSALLLTHIHLDHAGSTGLIVRQHPRVKVYVHERGAPHLKDPARLLESAGRLYGAAMDTMWGPFLPVPAQNIRALAGGEAIALGRRRLDVLYTPGHASHHVAYLEPDARVAFTGDVAGVRLAGRPLVLPPTPPPDIDLERWRASIAAITARAPATLFLTHFGPVDEPPGVHLQKLEDRLTSMAARVKAMLDDEGSDESRAGRFAAELGDELRRTLGDADTRRYIVAMPPEQCWQGLARYWRKKAAAAAS